MDEPIVDVQCNSPRKSNCAIKLDRVFCDGFKEGKSIGVFSHFHEDHIAAITECIGSYDVLITHPITFEGIVALKPGMRYREQWVRQDFDTAYPIHDGHIRLLKANRIPGSSQVYVETGDKSMLYSGDFNFPDIQIKQADYLVLGSTQGDPQHDGKTDRKSVKDRMFKDIKGFTNSNKSIVIQTSSGTLQELVRHFEISSGQKLSSDIAFVMDEKQQKVLTSIYKEEKNEFRNIVRYDSHEFWQLVRDNKKCIVFSTAPILDDGLDSFHKIIVKQFRFSKKQPLIIPFEGGCRYNLASHTSIEGIYSYIESVNPKYVITDYSKSEYAYQLAKLIEQKFPNIKTTHRPSYT